MLFMLDVVIRIKQVGVPIRGRTEGCQIPHSFSPRYGGFYGAGEGCSTGKRIVHTECTCMASHQCELFREGAAQWYKQMTFHSRSTGTALYQYEYAHVYEGC